MNCSWKQFTRASGKWSVRNHTESTRTGKMHVPPGILLACSLPNRRPAQYCAYWLPSLQQNVMDRVQTGMNRVIAAYQPDGAQAVLQPDPACRSRQRPLSQGIAMLMQSLRFRAFALVVGAPPRGLEGGPPPPPPPPGGRGGGPAGGAPPVGVPGAAPAQIHRRALRVWATRLARSVFRRRARTTGSRPASTGR